MAHHHHTSDLQHQIQDLKDTVEAMNTKIDNIHEAVGKLAKRVYIPGPSIWQRLGNLLGLIHL